VRLGAVVDEEGGQEAAEGESGQHAERVGQDGVPAGQNRVHLLAANDAGIVHAAASIYCPAPAPQPAVFCFSFSSVKKGPPVHGSKQQDKQSRAFIGQWIFTLANLIGCHRSPRRFVLETRTGTGNRLIFKQI